MASTAPLARWRSLAVFNTFSRPAEVTWDRCEFQSKDPTWLASQMARGDARVLLLKGHRASVQYPAEKASDGSRRASLAFHCGKPPGLTHPSSFFFLGSDSSGTPHFVAPARSVFTERDQVKGAPGQGGAASQGGDAPCSFVNTQGAGVSSKLINLRSVASQLTHHESSLVAHAKSLLEWHAENKFCANCGGPTTVKDGGKSVVCKKEEKEDSQNPQPAAPKVGCGKEVYPRTNPVAIMMVISPCGSKCLIGQTKERHIGNFYSVLAGFIDQGESMENAVKREVMEEAGVPVGQVQYHSSQPWPFSSNLMLGCFAQALTDKINFDPREMHIVKWATKAEIAAALAEETEDLMVPPKLALAHTLMRAWVEGKFPLLEETEGQKNTSQNSKL